jgi:hypothetical protein
MLPILIGCEESQTICKAYRSQGYFAYSCDLQPCSGGHPEWHIQEDIKKVIPLRQWGIIILHPDCTYMAVSGNRWYGKGMPLNYKRLQAIEWTLDLWELAKEYSDKVALENPISVIFSYLPNVQYIQPWQFGHGETKKTGLTLHNLPPLIPTDIVDGREHKIWKMAPSPTRKKDRSKTYPGIADAISKQWII